MCLLLLTAVGYHCVQMAAAMSAAAAAMEANKLNAPPKVKRITTTNPKAMENAKQWRLRQRFDHSIPRAQRPYWRTLFFPDCKEVVHTAKWEHELLDWMEENHPDRRTCYTWWTFALRPFVTEAERKRQTEQRASSASAAAAAASVLKPAARVQSIVDDD